MKGDCDEWRAAVRARRVSAHGEEKEGQEEEQHDGEDEKEAANEGAARYSRDSIRGVRCCTHCRRAWDRDTAAAISILALGRAARRGKPLPARFKRAALPQRAGP
jgi:hypothetical protein